MLINKQIFILIILFLFLIYIIYDNLISHKRKTKNEIISTTQSNTINDFENIKSRDFLRYDCKNLKRIGGNDTAKKNSPDNLWRIDGAWYICLDINFELDRKSCAVLSLGINRDYSFDDEMSKVYNCEVHSFDPFVEAKLFSDRNRRNLENYPQQCQIGAIS